MSVNRIRHLTIRPNMYPHPLLRFTPPHYCFVSRYQKRELSTKPTEANSVSARILSCTSVCPLAALVYVGDVRTS